jgi:hypothetical protein
MLNSKLIKKSLINAGLAALYVFVLSLLMSNNKTIPKGAPEFLIGVGMLLVFVISATVMGYLVLGKPILMYLDGAKKEALKLFYLTVTWLVLIAVIVFICLAIFK